MPSYPRIRLALLGAGIFARYAHVPSLIALRDTFEIAVVYSPHPAELPPLLDRIGHPVPVMSDLDAVLTRPDIDAVDIVLPIPVMPGVIERALAAGKHVISEKPAAPDVVTGERLLAFYAECRDRVWVVGENWRYEPSYQEAAAHIRAGSIGQPLSANLTVHTPMTPSNRYYQTLWRRDGSFPGGFLLDGGIHHVAGMRLVLGDIVSVQAITHAHRPDLPPADTLSATLQFASGVVAAYSVTYAGRVTKLPSLHITGSEGTLCVQRDRLSISRDGVSEQVDFAPHQSVVAELAAFADAIRHGIPHANPPAEALRDVAVIEAMLTSAATGRRMIPASISD